jgi:LmbE family N-acetylglucosaminyl deacetylase
MESALFIGAHPDDVETGAAGLLLRLASRMKIHYLVMSKCQDIPRNKYLLEEFASVAKLLNLSPEILDLPNRSVSLHGQEVRDALERYRDSNHVKLAVCPSNNDIHQDHKAVADEVIRVFRHCTVLFFETPHSCPFFEARLFVPLDQEIADKKVKVVSLYKSQRMMRYIHEEAILGTMRMRGAQCGHDYAEAFEVWRIVGGLVL